MSKTRPLSVLTLSLLVPVGCGGGGDGGNPDAAAPDAAALCQPDLPEPPPAPNGDISGTWGLFTKFYANVQGFGSAQISRGYYLHEYVQDGDALTVTETFCNLEVDSEDGGTRIRVAQSFIDSQDQTTRTGSVTPDGAGGYDVTLDLSYVARGVMLTDVVNEELPADATDPRVFDQDEDGNPGLTLLLDGVLRGQLYIVQRDYNSYSGPQVSADRVEGLASWGNDITYVGAQPEVLLDVVEPAIPDPDPNLHTFQLVRLPPGADCQYILENRCNLFAGVE